MFKHLIVVFALVAGASATLTPEERMLHMHKGALEAVVFSEQQRQAPERILMAVDELASIYSKLPLPEKPVSGERAMRDMVAVLHSIGQPNKDNCEMLAEFNKDVDLLVERFANLKDVCNFARFYQAKQNQMC